MPPKRTSRSTVGGPAAKRGRGVVRGGARSTRGRVPRGGAPVDGEEQQDPVAPINDDVTRDSSPVTPRSSPEREAQPDNNAHVESPRLGRGTAALVNSTEIAVSENLNEINPTTRLVEVLERTFNSLQNSSLSNGNSRLVNRLTTAKNLPTFAGDALEWFNFKKAYESSTLLGEYTEQENITRLNEALKGEARETVCILLATSRDTEEIMRTLELHYGNKKIIAQKIIDDLKRLPSLESGKISLMQFASKLKNSAVAFKNLSLTGYLHSPELIKSIGSKLLPTLKFAYNRYAATASAQKSGLEKLADFLYNEAELATSAGLFDVDEAPAPRSSFSNKRNPNYVRSGAVCTVKHVSNRDEANRGEGRQMKFKPCFYCKRNNHRLHECTQFEREPLHKKWAFAKKSNVCFNCLKGGHFRDECKNTMRCSHCKSLHHSFLHAAKNPKDNTQTNKPRQPLPGNQNVSGNLNTTFNVDKTQI